MRTNALNRTLTKLGLVLRVSAETGLPQERVADVVQKTLDTIANALSYGDRVELRDFGVFEVRVSKGRLWRNPKNPAMSLSIPARGMVRFRAGKEMRAEVRKLTI